MDYPDILKGVRTQQRDVDTLLFSARHPVATREYLNPLTKQKKDKTRYRKRLNLFTAPDFADNRVLYPFYRDSFQKNAEWRYKKRLISPTHYGIDFLKEVGLPHLPYRPRNEHFLHKMMRSMCHASLRIAADEQGWENVYLDQILARKECPKDTALSLSPLRVPLSSTTWIELDELISFYTGKTFRTHPFEADRGSQDVGDRGVDLRDSFEKKARGYDVFIRKELYATHWGINSIAPVLWITTTPGRAASMIQTLKDAEDIRYKEDHYIKSVSGFQTRGWQIPDIMRHLFTEPWDSVNGPIFINQ